MRLSDTLYVGVYFNYVLFAASEQHYLYKLGAGNSTKY